MRAARAQLATFARLAVKLGSKLSITARGSRRKRRSRVATPSDVHRSAGSAASQTEGFRLGWRLHLAGSLGFTYHAAVGVRHGGRPARPASRPYACASVHRTCRPAGPEQWKGGRRQQQSGSVPVQKTGRRTCRVRVGSAPASLGRTRTGIRACVMRTQRLTHAGMRADGRRAAGRRTILHALTCSLSPVSVVSALRAQNSGNRPK